MRVEDCVVVVPSTDTYSDLWEPFLFYFYRYWPDCPYRVILGANHTRREVVGAKVVTTGVDGPWGMHVRALVRDVGSRCVLVMMPDYFLEAAPLSGRIAECVALVSSGSAPLVRLVPSPRPRRRVTDAGVGFASVRKNELYATSLVATVWSLDELLRVVRPTDSPWSFERRTEGDGCGPPVALSVVEPLLHYDPRGALVRGHWTKRAQRRLRADGMGFLLEGRRKMTWGGAMMLAVQGVIYRALLVACPQVLRLWYRGGARRGTDA